MTNSPQSPQQSIYRGRFAPSPTGPLHFGSLIAATGSYLQAKSQAGEWLVRIDDIDPPREVAGATDEILLTLEQFGFEWDGPVSYQSQRIDYYQNAVDTLLQNGLAYPCGCTRKTIAAAQSEADKKHIYPGTCRHGLAGKSPRMIRINTSGHESHFIDQIQGQCDYQLEKDTGDFVIHRADGLIAYQLATGIDDAEQGISDVIRGYDLLDSTPCQILIQQSLGLSTPTYGHLPIVQNSQGQKLSKQNLAPSLNSTEANALICQAMNFLGQNVPVELAQEPLQDLWNWSIKNWDISLVPRQQFIQLKALS